MEAYQHQDVGRRLIKFLPSGFHKNNGPPAICAQAIDLSLWQGLPQAQGNSTQIGAFFLC